MKINLLAITLTLCSAVMAEHNTPARSSGASAGRVIVADTMEMPAGMIEDKYIKILDQKSNCLSQKQLLDTDISSMYKALAQVLSSKRCSGEVFTSAKVVQDTLSRSLIATPANNCLIKMDKDASGIGSGRIFLKRKDLLDDVELTWDAEHFTTMTAFKWLNGLDSAALGGHVGFIKQLEAKGLCKKHDAFGPGDIIGGPAEPNEKVVVILTIDPRWFKIPSLHAVLNARLKRAGFETTDLFSELNIVAGTIPQGNIEKLKKIAGVVSVEESENKFSDK